MFFHGRGCWVGLKENKEAEKYNFRSNSNIFCPGCRVNFIVLSAIIQQRHSNEVKHSELKVLTTALPSLLIVSRAPNTVKKYRGYFNQCFRWCEKFTEVQNLPAKEIHVALFLVSLIQICILESTNQFVIPPPGRMF